MCLLRTQGFSVNTGHIGVGSRQYTGFSRMSFISGVIGSSVTVEIQRSGIRGVTFTNSSFILANFVTRESYTTKVINNHALASLIGNVKYTISTQQNTSGLFYGFSDIGNDSISAGGGINIFGWLGLEGYYTTDGNLGVSSQLTPWFHVGSEIGLSGIGIKGGVDIGNTAHDISITVGWGTAAVTVLALTPVPGARAAAAATAFVLFIGGLVSHGNGGYYF